MIAAAVKEQPQMTAVAVKQQLGLQIRVQTVRNRLHGAGMHHRIPARKPLLMQQHKEEKMGPVYSYINCFAGTTILIASFISSDDEECSPQVADDSYPYANAAFPSSNQGNQESSHILLMAIYQTHNYEKDKTYGESKQKRDSRVPGQMVGRGRSRSHGGGVDSDDYQMLGSETETEHGGVSSRTESSNQLDDVLSIRDQSVYSRDSVYSGDSARTLPVKDPREVGLKKEREGAGNAASQGFQQRIHHNLLYHAESSTSPEPSPTTERKSFLRHARARYTVTPACNERLTKCTKSLLHAMRD
ncbi:uncharacterized protein [Macrobrachium rosenbergii]|uniref:uncharacterized protein n=1 Tax=Macrobrachium rosenbergii TaxID=79674 RepID=UPI0034D72E55